MTTALIARIAKGEPSAMNEFHAHYHRSIRALALRIVGNEWDADEVVQDVMWTVYRKAGSFRGEAHFQRWVNRVTHNASLMLLRKRRRLPVPVDAADMNERLESGIENRHGDHPEQVVILHRHVARLNKCLDELDPVNRQVFTRMHVAGDAKEDVAEDLGLSVSALKARLHRTRSALRETLVPLAA